MRSFCGLTATFFITTLFQALFQAFSNLVPDHVALLKPSSRFINRRLQGHIIIFLNTNSLVYHGLLLLGPARSYTNIDLISLMDKPVISDIRSGAFLVRPSRLPTASYLDLVPDLLLPPTSQPLPRFINRRLHGHIIIFLNPNSLVYHGLLLLGPAR